MRQAVEVAISELRGDGTLGGLTNKWLPEAICTSDTAAGAASGGGARSRRSLLDIGDATAGGLNELSGRGGGRIGGGGIGGGIGGRSWRSGRSLKGGGGGGGSGSESGSAGDEGFIADGVKVIGPRDFIGVFVLWGAVTLFVLAWRYLTTWCGLDHRLDRCYKKVVATCTVTEAEKMRRQLKRAETKRKKQEATATATATGGSPRGLQRALTQSWEKNLKLKNVISSVGMMRRAVADNKPDIFDISNVNVQDVNGMVLRILHQNIALRKELKDDVSDLKAAVHNGAAAPSASSANKQPAARVTLPVSRTSLATVAVANSSHATTAETKSIKAAQTEIQRLFGASPPQATSTPLASPSLSDRIVSGAPAFLSWRKAESSTSDAEGQPAWGTPGQQGQPGIFA